MTGDTAKVLVVDDDPVARDFIADALEAFGYACQSAQNGLDALTRLQGGAFDLLVTDLDMPGMDGLALIEHIRSSDSDLPILIMTSRTDLETGRQALRLGVSDYFVKPIDNPGEVQAAVRRALQNAEVRDLPEMLAWELERKADQPTHLGQGTSPAVRHSEDVPRIRGYDIQEQIGRGGVGTVYKALQLATQRVVALKVLPFSDGTDQVVTCLVREVHVAQRLQHPNIIRGFDAGLSGGYFYVAMEYVEGEALSDRLGREGALPEPQALDIARQVVAALTHAWEVGLVHRDVKPHNILLAKDGVAKLADLGITRDVTGLLNTITSEGVVVGTPLYMAPEQAEGVGGVDWRADVYGLGATLYHMVCGDTPFDANLCATTLMLKHTSEDPLPAYLRNASVSLRVSRLIEKMMRKDPGQRYANPGELVMDFERILRGEGVGAESQDAGCLLASS